MQEAYFFYTVALGGVIGIGWLVVVPMYKGWTPLNQRMTRCISRSVRVMEKKDRRPF